MPDSGNDFYDRLDQDLRLVCRKNRCLSPVKDKFGIWYAKAGIFGDKISLKNAKNILRHDIFLCSIINVKI